MPEVAAQEAEAYRIIRRPDRYLGLTDQDRAELVARGLGADVPAIEDYAHRIRDLLADAVVAKRLEAIGAPVHADTIAVARTHLIRAAASACTRVQRVFDDDIMDVADPIAALMADLGPSATLPWQHMVDHIAERPPLPTNPAGKGPDIHSIRACGSSFYEVDGVNALMRADVMGHAREGTNGKHYSKRMATEGLDVVLPERRDFIERYVPTITGNIEPHPIRLLPLEKRSRIGAGITRKRRSDAGVSRTGAGGDR